MKSLQDMVDSKNNTDLIIPKGKLASFFWYEVDEKLLENEKIVMEKYFPIYKLGKLNDGSLFWEGVIKPELIGNTECSLRLVYSNTYPNDA